MPGWLGEEGKTKACPRNWKAERRLLVGRNLEVKTKARQRAQREAMRLQMGPRFVQMTGKSTRMTEGT